MEMEKDETLNNDDAFEFNDNTGELHPEGTFRFIFDGFSAATSYDEKTKERVPDQFGRMAVALKSPKKRQEGEKAGERFVIYRKMKPSTHPKSLMRKFLFAIGIDVDKVGPKNIKLAPRIGTPLFATVEHEAAKDNSGAVYAVVTGFMPLPVEEEEEEKPATAPEKPEKAEKREPVGAAAGGGKKPRPDFDDDEE